MLDRADIPSGFRAIPAPPMPLARLVEGRPVEEVAEILPRLFNLCRVAQSVALRLALGLPAGDMAGLSEEIARDHRLKLGVIWPARLGLGRLALPLWSEGLPETPEAFDAFISGVAPLATVLRAVRDGFTPGLACCAPLPEVVAATALAATAQENSPAARHLTHPVMRRIEETDGRGPLWRVFARALDLAAVTRGALPAPQLIGPGAALVPAARGLYAVRAEVRRGRVIRLTRVTPTDHLLAPEGIMAQSLASLPATAHSEARLVADLLDPCAPVTIEGGA
ncbi:hydrogenase expression/formation protein HupK [Roseovarius autotrophicus]|uniref:hydrogenase expression/formation protein HupK n=1 Tax=Roseovarius autotrophicus TaxID=2824121 RepID=UPI0019D94012|nr:hydrogenase expression/formation protein HupK [Roseovarius autotrophicus]MBE0452160.1 hydrogenase expression/formation protein HupK [Roseovarius sp.]